MSKKSKYINIASNRSQKKRRNDLRSAAHAGKQTQAALSAPCSPDKLIIVMPAYNEEANIEAVVREWHDIVLHYGTDSQLLVVDDGSKDTTYKTLLALKEHYPRLEAVTKPNSGHGATLLYAYDWALSHGADYVFQTDSDGQTLPSEFAPFWKMKDDYAMVIGSRKGRKDGFSRVIVTKTLKLVCLLCFHVKIEDANTPYRLMQAKALSDNMKIVPPDFFLSNVALSAVYARRKQAVKFVPITFRPRQGGVNSINMKRIIKIGFKALKDFRAVNNMLKAES
jgi:glycosyltransferase involved in cell wall biosynthesis